MKERDNSTMENKSPQKWTPPLDVPSYEGTDDDQQHEWDESGQAGEDLSSSNNDGSYYELSLTAKHDITREFLRGPEKLGDFGELILRGLVHDSKLLKSVSHILNMDAKTGKRIQGDFLSPQDNLLAAAMLESFDTAIPGVARASGSSEWTEAIALHIESFLEKTPDFPASIANDVNARLSNLRPLKSGELDLICDGFVDYIRGVRLHYFFLISTGLDPAAKMEKFLEISNSVVSPGARHRWLGIDEIGDIETTAFVVEDLIAEGSGAMIYGPPGSGKTFFALDLACSIAAGRHWNGKKTAEGTVLYYCLEGGSGFKNRVRAMKRKGKLEKNDPFFFSIEALDLRSSGASRRILDDIQTNRKRSGRDVKLIVIDTLAVATSGGNESTSEDMGAALAAISEAIRSSGVTVLLLHHPGKDVARGPRGWSGIVGNLDTIIEIEETDNVVRRAKITKQKDGQEGIEFPFKLKPVDLGVATNGQSVISCELIFLSEEEAAIEAGKDPREIVKVLWASRHEDSLLATGDIGGLLGFTQTGGGLTTRVTGVMSKLTLAGFVENGPRGHKNRHQWKLTTLGKSLLRVPARQAP